jgi:trimeric autotransporter adhesin
VAAITPAPLTAGSFTATNRAYDGSTTVAVSATGATLTGVIGGDSVSVDLSGVTSGTVANKNVGTGKAVTVSGISITGTDAGNYRLTGSDTVTVDITPKVLTVNGLTVDNREYDRSVNIYNHQFNRDVATLSGAVSGDQVTLDQYHSISGVMADKNVGTSKPVTVTGLRLRGADAGNYAVQQGSVVADITPQPMYIYLSYTNNGYIKTYDGSAAAGPNVYLYNYYGIGGDNLTWSATSIGYADKNVAYDSNGQVTNKTITANGITLAGTDAGNYALQNTSTTLTGRINPRPLAVSGVSAVDRVYDGTRDVTVNIGSATVDTSNVVPGDQVSVVLVFCSA